MTTVIILFVTGVTFLVLAIHTLLHYKKLNRIGLTAEGIVIDSKHVYRGRYKYPVIQFKTAGGGSVIHTYRLGAPRTDFKKGSKLTLIYSPDKLTDFFIKAPYTTRGPIAAVICSSIIIAIAIWLYVQREL